MHTHTHATPVQCPLPTPHTHPSPGNCCRTGNDQSVESCRSSSVAGVVCPSQTHHPHENSPRLCPGLETCSCLAQPRLTNSALQAAVWVAFQSVSLKRQYDKPSTKTSPRQACCYSPPPRQPYPPTHKSTTNSPCTIPRSRRMWGLLLRTMHSCCRC